MSYPNEVRVTREKPKRFRPRIPHGKVLGTAAGVSVRDAVQQAVEKRLTGYLVVKGEGIIIVDEGRILHAVTLKRSFRRDEVSRNASGEEALKRLLPMTADIEVHALDDIEMVILIRMLRIEIGAQLNHVLTECHAAKWREELLRKYGIQEPSEIEVENIIKRALEE